MSPTLPKMPTPQMDHVEAQLKEMATIASERLKIQLQLDELQRTDTVLANRQVALFYTMQGVEQGRKLETERGEAVAFEEKQRQVPQKTVDLPDKPNTRQDLVVTPPPPPPPPAK